MMVIRSFWPLNGMNRGSHLPSPFMTPFLPLDYPNMALQGFLPYQPTNKTTKTINFSWRLCCLHVSSSPTELEVPRLNSPALFSFGGEAHLEIFPLLVDKFSKNLRCFFNVLRRIGMDKSEMDRVIVFLQMIFDRNWPLAVNQITKPKTNIKVCFVMSAKLPIRTKKSGQLHFLKMLKANLLPNGAAPKILKKVDTFIFIWETLMHGVPKNNYFPNFHTSWRRGKYSRNTPRGFSCVWGQAQK